MELRGGGLAHGAGVLEPADASYGIRTARVDDDAAQTGSAAGFKHGAAYLNWGCSEFVSGEDGSAKSGAVRGDKGKVWVGFVGGLDAHMGPGDFEASGVCPGCWDVFDLRGGDGGVNGSRVVAHKGSDEGTSWGKL